MVFWWRKWFSICKGMTLNFSPLNTQIWAELTQYSCTLLFIFSPHLCPSECKHLSLRICWQFHYQHFHFSNPSPIYILIESPVSSCSKYMINHQYHQYIPSHPAFSVLPEAELASKYIVHLISYFPTVFLCHLSFRPQDYSLSSEICSMEWRKQYLQDLANTSW